MKTKFFLIFILLPNFITLAQKPIINKVEPPNWWIHHEYSDIQLLIYGDNLSNASVTSEDTNLEIQKIPHSNKNYLFVNVKISSSAKGQNYNFFISNKYGSDTLNFPLFERDNSKITHQGFSDTDVVYLIFPDRFFDGDTTNDHIFKGNDEFAFGSLNGRHGGDIQGIIDKLDYLKDLGITTIWITPLVENNTYMSYHGYAATNFYKIDPRFGTNDLYKNLVKRAHDKGLKIIMDHVTNHIGINHEWISKPPTKTWIHGTVQNHMPAQHDKIALVDIHADSSSIHEVNTGWFVKEMPDLNQSDTLLAKYMIQNTIWWIEFSGIDGIREDTYPYSNQKFMSFWAKTILSLYPKMNIVGEVWRGDPNVLAAFQTKSYFPRNFDSNLPVVTDFAMKDAITSYLSGNSNLTKIYETLGQDFVYSNPNNLLIFFDNHDTDRGMYAAKDNINKYKQALTIILTSRGIPQLFYGTEIGMNGGGHHGKIRTEFSGGFPNDSLNAFTETGRNKEQNEIYNFTHKLLQLRKKYKSLQIGKLTQFIPEDNIYIYKKVLGNEEILIFLSDNNLKKEINPNKYIEHGINSFVLKNLLTDEILNIDKNTKIDLSQNSVSIFSVLK